MPLKNILHELKEMKAAIRSKPMRGVEGNHWRRRSKSHIAPESVEQGQWANLPPDLLLDIIQRVEESETAWSSRTVIIFCASVCRSWRDITKEIVKTPDECKRLTFPISLKLPGPRDAPIQCFIMRDKATSTYRLHFNFAPSEDDNDKLLLAAKRIRRATSTDFVISLVGDDFSRASSAYVGKLRSNFLGNKFTIYDIQPPNEAAVKHINRESRRFNAKQVSPRLPAYNYRVATIRYELHVFRSKGPRQMHCVMLPIPASSVQEGGNVPTPKSFPQLADEKSPSSQVMNGNEAAAYFEEALVLKNRAPWWNDEMQCWCLNFRGRVTVPSVKNFQLVTADDPLPDAPAAEHETVILQFGKIAEDIFTMDYRYPLSAFQAFAICLSSFDSKAACE